MRPKEKNDEEKRIVEELRKIENVIKKEEKEKKNLETIMKLDTRDEVRWALAIILEIVLIIPFL